MTYKETKKGLNQAVRDFQYVAENSPIDKTLSDAPVANIIIAENEKLSVINQTSLGDGIKNAAELFQNLKKEKEVLNADRNNLINASKESNDESLQGDIAAIKNVLDNINIALTSSNETKVEDAIVALWDNQQWLTHKETKEGLNQAVQDFQYVAESNIIFDQIQQNKKTDQPEQNQGNVISAPRENPVKAPKVEKGAKAPRPKHLRGVSI